MHNARTLNPLKLRQSVKTMKESLAALAIMHKRGTLLNPQHAARYISRERYRTSTSITLGADGRIFLLTETRKGALAKFLGRQSFKTLRQPLRRARK